MKLDRLFLLTAAIFGMEKVFDDSDLNISRVTAEEVRKDIEKMLVDEMKKVLEAEK